MQSFTLWSWILQRGPERARALRFICIGPGRYGRITAGLCKHSRAGGETLTVCWGKKFPAADAERLAICSLRAKMYMGFWRAIDLEGSRGTLWT